MRPKIDIDTKMTFQSENEAISQAEMLAQHDNTFHVPLHARALSAEHPQLSLESVQPRVLG